MKTAAVIKRNSGAFIRKKRMARVSAFWTAITDYPQRQGCMLLGGVAGLKSAHQQPLAPDDGCDPVIQKQLDDG